MRSYGFRCFMKDKLLKVKRKRVDWVHVLNDLDNEAMLSHFYMLVSSLHHGRSISMNRCAYNTIRHFYSTTTIEDTLEKLGL